MLRGLINDAKSAAGRVVAKYAVRASVAVPFVIALGFATAGITLMLVERALRQWGSGAEADERSTPRPQEAVCSVDARRIIEHSIPIDLPQAHRR